MSHTLSIAVIGATGNVGRQVLSILAERRFPCAKVHAVASPQSKGKKVSFGEEQILTVESIEEIDFAAIDIAFFAAGSAVSQRYARKAAAEGCIVIDKSSYFRMHEDVPLVIPEVNPHALEGVEESGIIAVPNCALSILLTGMAPLIERYGIRKIVATSLQSVSGAGKAAMDELYYQTKGKFTTENHPAVIFGKAIAFNVIPQIGEIESDGLAAEERKMIQELQKILDRSCEMHVTCIRVPVFVGHSLSVYAECVEEVSHEEVYAMMEECEGSSYVRADEPSAQPTPIDIVGEDPVFMSRLRIDPVDARKIQMWILGDNLRQGAALAAVKIAELLYQEGYVG